MAPDPRQPDPDRDHAAPPDRRPDRLAAACFDRIPDHLAVIDTTGTIVRINHAWRRFGRENGLTIDGDGVGLNYLDICERARGHCAGEAVEVHDHLLDLLRGAEKTAEVVYPCFAPDTPRWFAVKLFPLDLDDQRHIGIAHQNITALVMAHGGVVP